MHSNGKRQPQIVDRFLALADAMQGGVKSREAEAAFRALMSWPTADKEELLFRTLNSCARQKARLIEFNNERMLAKLAGKRLRKVLLLIPFCLQHRNCPHQVAWNLENCANCGRCAIGPLRELTRKRGMVMRVAIRSMFAPMFVRRGKPEAVLAVACQEELLAGLLRVHPVPCYCVLNARPEGPCKNTKVDLKTVEAAVKSFVNHVPARSRR